VDEGLDGDTANHTKASEERGILVVLRIFLIRALWEERFSCAQYPKNDVRLLRQESFSIVLQNGGHAMVGPRYDISNFDHTRFGTRMQCSCLPQLVQNPVESGPIIIFSIARTMRRQNAQCCFESVSSIHRRDRGLGCCIFGDARI
jgi:hypothetical protein